jgi:hypothetical protein
VHPSLRAGLLASRRINFDIYQYGPKREYFVDISKEMDYTEALHSTDNLPHRVKAELQNCWTRLGSLIIDLGIIICDNKVDITHQPLREHRLGLYPILSLLNVLKGRGNDTFAGEERSEQRFVARFAFEFDGDGFRLRVGKGERNRGEGLDGKMGVGFRAVCDQCRRNGVDLVKIKGNLWSGGSAQRCEVEIEGHTSKASPQAEDILTELSIHAA